MSAPTMYTKTLALFIAAFVMLAVAGTAGAKKQTVSPTDRIVEVTSEFQDYNIAYVEIKSVEEANGDQKNQELRVILINPELVAKVHFKKGLPKTISLADLVTNWEGIIGSTGSMTIIKRDTNKELFEERIGSIIPIFNTKTQNMVVRYRTFADMLEETPREVPFGDAKNVRIVFRPHVEMNGFLDSPDAVPGGRAARIEAGFTPTLPYRGDQQLAQGVLSQTAQPIGQCIKSSLEAAPNAGASTATSGQIWVSTSASSVAKDMKVGGSVSYDGGLFSAEGSASYSTSSTASNNSVYVYTKVHVTKENQSLGTTVTVPWTGSTVAEALEYLNRCGDAVPVSINYGATYTAIVRLDTKSSEEASSMSAQLKGAYGGAKISAEAQQNMSKKTEGTNATASQECLGPRDGNACTGANGQIDISSGPAAISSVIRNYNHAFENLGNVISGVDNVVYQPIWVLQDATSTGSKSVLVDAAKAVQAIQSNAQDGALRYNETANAYLYAARNPQFYRGIEPKYAYEKYYYFASLAKGLSTWSSQCAAGQLTSSNDYACAQVYTACANAPGVGSSACQPGAFSARWANIAQDLRKSRPVDPDPSLRTSAARSTERPILDTRKSFDPDEVPDPNVENLLPPMEAYPQTCNSFLYNNNASGAAPVNGSQVIYFNGNPKWKMRVVCTWKMDNNNQFHGTAWLPADNYQHQSAFLFGSTSFFPYMKYHEELHVVDQYNHASSKAFVNTITTSWGESSTPGTTGLHMLPSGATITWASDAVEAASGVHHFGASVYYPIRELNIDTAQFGWYFAESVQFTGQSTLSPSGCKPGGSRPSCKASGGSIRLVDTDSAAPQRSGILGVKPFPTSS